jgi:hypothetical protein
MDCVHLTAGWFHLRERAKWLSSENTRFTLQNQELTLDERKPLGRPDVGQIV